MHDIPDQLIGLGPDLPCNRVGNRLLFYPLQHQVLFLLSRRSLLLISLLRFLHHSGYLGIVGLSSFLSIIVFSSLFGSNHFLENVGCLRHLLNSLLTLFVVGDYIHLRVK